MMECRQGRRFLEAIAAGDWGGTSTSPSCLCPVQKSCSHPGGNVRPPWDVCPQHLDLVWMVWLQTSGVGARSFLWRRPWSCVTSGTCEQWRWADWSPWHWRRPASLPWRLPVAAWAARSTKKCSSGRTASSSLEGKTQTSFICTRKEVKLKILADEVVLCL